MIETLLQRPHESTNKSQVTNILNEKVAELKSHVFAARQQFEGDRHKTAPSHSLHEDIIQQSEQVLNGLKELGEIPTELEQHVGPAVNWADVQKSIALQLSSESEQQLAGSSVPGSEASTPRAADDGMPVLNRTSRALPAHVTGSLAEAVERELGMKVNITIEPAAAAAAQLPTTPTPSAKVPDTDPDDIIAQTFGKKYKLDHDKMNKEYEDLRKKRLAMLVQAYTGKTDTELVLKNTGTKTVPKVETESKSELSEVEKIIANHLGATATTAAAPAATSTDTSAIKEKLRRMREQLAKNVPAEDPVAPPPVPATSTSMPAPPAPSKRPAVLQQAMQAAEAYITQRDSTSKSTAASTRHKPAAHPRSKREIYPHKKGYQSAAKYYKQVEDEESVTTDQAPYDADSMMSDTTTDQQSLSDVSDPRNTSLYQRTYRYPTHLFHFQSYF